MQACGGQDRRRRCSPACLQQADLLNSCLHGCAIASHADMFESTMDILYNLWDAVSVGGYVIIDDWT